MQVSYDQYHYFASGRKNCLYLDFKIENIRRQCILTQLLYDFPRGKTDTVTIDVPIDLNGRQMPLDLFICRRKDIKAYMAQFEYMKETLKNSNTKNYRLSDSEQQSKNALMILSEHDEIANQVITQFIGNNL